MKRYAAILLEGSSSATGLFDEQRHGGFTGRIESHYDAYNEMTCLGVKQDPHWVFVHRHGQPDLQPTEIAEGLREHLSEVDRRPADMTLGVFVLGIQSDYDAYRFGEQRAIGKWATGLNKLGDAIACRPIQPLLMTSPRYSTTTPLGIDAEHNPELRQEYLRYVKGLAYELRAPLISFEQATGETLAEFGALDQRHANARGHQKVANFILPILDYKLGITDDPMARERLESSILKTSADFLIH